MAKYEITTDKGKYIVETEPISALQQPMQQPQIQPQIQPQVPPQPTWGGRIMTAPQRVAQLEAQRPSAEQALMEEVTQPWQPLKHPLATAMRPLVTGLKTLGVPYQRGISALTAPVTEAQKGQFGQIPRSIWESILGKRKVEAGDIPRLAGVPEIPSAAIGFVGEAALTGKLLQAKAPQWLSKTASHLNKLSKYGRDMGRVMIKHAMGLSDDAVEHGMNKGWHNVLQKRFVRVDAERIPDEIAIKAEKGLKIAYKNMQTKYGQVLDSVKEGNTSIINPVNSLGQKLQEIRGSPKLTPLQNRIVKHFDDLTEKMGYSELDNVSIGDLQIYKQALKKMIRKTVIERKISPMGDEKLILDYIDDINTSIARMSNINKEYANFMNVYKQTHPLLQQKVGETIQITGRPFRNFFKQSPIVKQAFKYADDVVSEPYKFLDEVMDWATTKEALVIPQTQGFSLYPFRLLAESTKYATRQALKYKPLPEQAIKYGVPPSVLRGMRRE